MKELKEDLLFKIEFYPLEKIKSFVYKLSRTNLWSEIYTLRVIQEYKRFMFLSAISERGLTPSIEVDECWHLHMLYTQDYAKFCNILEKFIHHGPGTGGKEDEKFVDWYDYTKKQYLEFFSKEPPVDIWPPSKIRFRNVNFVRIDLLTHWVVPKDDWKALLKCLFKLIKFKIRRLC